jgi:catechol 2,3-dioxygenase-like lactoylglutathione lyase family enzyme
MKFTPGEINIICTNIEESLHFYRDLLGFEVLEEEDGCYHLRCSAHLFLLLPVASGSAKIVPYCSIPTFSVDLMTPDLQAAYQYIESQGVQFERHWTPGARSFIIRDPDGLIWEIISELKDK